MKRKLLQRAVTLMLRKARTGLYTARQLRNQYAPTVTVRRVQQLLSAEPNLSWERMPQAPLLYACHREARLERARRNCACGGRFWRRVVWSNESQFTLDGPDGLTGYWKDKNRPGRWHCTRRHQGGGVMVWGGFSHYGRTELKFINEIVDSSRYCSILDTTLIAFIDK